MSDPFLAEIAMLSFSAPPKGWALCNGQLLPINQNQALFALLGTTYGGNGQTTFALPNLRGCVPIHVGNGHIQGERAGSTATTITMSQLPAHTHLVNAQSGNGNTNAPSGAVPAKSLSLLYTAPSGLVAMEPTVVTNIGGSQAHNNMQPYLVISFVIALQGIFPSRN